MAESDEGFEEEHQMRTASDAVVTIPVGQCGPADASVSLEEYASAAPWPHVVVDGAFDPALIEAAEAEQISVARDLRPHVSRHLIKAESSEIVGAVSEQLVGQLDSDEWVRFLSELTGIEGLVSDPFHFWAGLHVGPTGAFQRVHRDFQKHPATGLYHRVNVLVYLSSGWTPDDGGELELWSPDAKRCVRSVAPEPGRLVIFESSPTTLHAVARQSSSDPDRLRLSFAAYYYSQQPPPGGLRRMGPLLQPRVPGEPLLASFIDVGDALRGARRRAAMLPVRVKRLVRRG
jgi:Rps23 Pro-64 3,4-dihydroxylase Tpa1-like proline 4-hydroxylase